jgi:hypothetical protein
VAHCFINKFEALKMKFKPGDKVRFLNQSGGGIVTKIISPQMVSVAIEEGFEIPTLTNELIKTESQDAGGRFFDKDYKVSMPPAGSEKTTAKNQKAALDEEDEHERIFAIKKGKGAEASSVWLAFIPHDQKWLITGLIDVCLLNPTDYDMLFSFLLRREDNQWSGADYDVLPPESGITLATLSRDELGDWLEGVVQMLFQKELQQKPVMPANAAFRLKPARFQKEDNYIENAFLDEKALLVNLALVSMKEITPEQTEGAEPSFESRVQTPKPKALIDKHRIAPFEAEVDLHISALKDDFSKLTNHEILKIQTDYFQKSLESALEAQYRKIIFIHGIGNGTLRNTIIEMLKEYEELTVQNASFKKYGYGAIEVVNQRPE